MNRFAAFAYDSDEEEEVVVKPVLVPSKVQAKVAVAVAVPEFYYPTLKAMMDHTEAWGDLCGDSGSIASSVTLSPVDEILANRENERRCEYEEDLTRGETSLWDQSWSAKIDEVMPTYFKLSELDNYEYADAMTWLYDQGWHIDVEERAFVRAWPANLPPRVWIAPIREFCCGDLSPCKKEKASKPVKLVQRFCRERGGGVHCGYEGCRFIHEDTIPRVNKPCQFGNACGKREGCLFIHPDETWVEGMVLTRPISIPAPAAPSS